MENQRVLMDLNSRFGIEIRSEHFSYIFVHGFAGPQCVVTISLLKEGENASMRVSEIVLEKGYGSLLGLGPIKKQTMKLRPKHEFTMPHDNPQFDAEVMNWVEMFLSRDDILLRIHTFINQPIQDEESSGESDTIDESEDDIT